ncbi:MAG: YihA family ribosome biogenesis GTP-binding protein [Bacteroidales bacterium]|nr:YihA family ribosome biogenesis GTP-binding protein [Bacteroidales bacterium]
MQIKEAIFTKSSSTWKECPAERMPEYAFIGRSNVGKSSFINMLTNNSKLAKTSSKPGKTQLINHFLINKEWFLVDLPGYGYAKINKTVREGFNEMIAGYFLHSKNLVYMCVLIDSRLEPQKIDLEFLRTLGENNIPFVLIFTKADKLSGTKVRNNVQTFLDTLSAEWEELPYYFITSAETGLGKDEFLDFIEQSNKEVAEIFQQ